MNRYAWTNKGPVMLMNGRAHSTAKCRRFLQSQGFQFESWARNFMAFIGWAEIPIYMPN